MRMRSFCLLSSFGLLLCFACKGKSEQNATPASTSVASSQESNAKRTTTQEVDQTLTLEEYEKKGVPAANKVWSTTEYNDAYEAVSKLSKNAWPRAASKRSGELFARIVHPGNLNPIGTDVQDIESRVMAEAAKIRPVTLFLQLYVQGLSEGVSFKREVLALSAHMIKLGGNLLDSVDILLPRMDPKAADYKERMQGFAQVKAGTVKIVQGAIATLTERQTFGLSHLTWYTQQLVGSLKRLIKRLEPSMRDDAMEKLRELASKESDANYKAALRTLVDDMQNEK